jgi:acetolactate synthase small subunit
VQVFFPEEEKKEECMTVRVAVRLVLADKPGMLATAAKLVADMGANVVGLEVLESDEGKAVDDLMIEIDNEQHLNELCQALRQMGDVDIEHVRILAADAEERGLQVLSAAVSILETTNSTASLATLLGLTKSLFGAEWSTLIDLRTEQYFESTGDVPDPEWIMGLIKRARNETISTWAHGCWIEVCELAESGVAISFGRAVKFRGRERRELEMLVRITDRMCRPIRGDRIPASWGVQ